MLNNSKTEKRIKWIDNAKGISILLVIIGHTSGGINGKSIWDFSFVYGIHLVMFFLLSGYTFKKKPISRDYVSAKFIRLMIPYFYTCLAVLVMDSLNSWIWEHDLSIASITNVISRDLIRSFFASGTYTSFGPIEMGTRIGAIWFLPAMFFSVLLFQLIIHASENRLIRALLSAGSLLIAFTTASFIWLPYSVQSGMFAVFFLWIGHEIKERKLLSSLKWYHYLIAQIILLVGISKGMCVIWFVTAGMNDLLLSIPVGLSGCLLIYLLSIIDTKGWVLEYLGRISLTILCVHLFALETMSRYFNVMLDKLGISGQPEGWCFMAMHLLFACIVAIAIDKRRRLIFFRKESSFLHGEKQPHMRKKERDVSIDIEKGLLIILMLIGHFNIDPALRSTIYSFHMEAFVLLSGYFYNKKRSFIETVKRMTRTLLLPYCVAAALTVFLDPSLWNNEAIKHIAWRYITGISFSKVLFNQFESVGPIWFILMLFITRAIYHAVDRIVDSKGILTGVVIAISLAGVLLGQKGLWLPWSIDVALYSLIFYHIGRMCKEYNVFVLMKTNGASYFILAGIWAYMIYTGSMEIAIRNYGHYGIAIIGAVAGTALLYSLSSYIASNMHFVSSILAKIGNASIVVLVVHTVLRPQIGSIIALRFNPDYFPFMTFSIVAQLMIAVIIMELINKCRVVNKHVRVGRF